jgi:hypothetical protein
MHKAPTLLNADIPVVARDIHLSHKTRAAIERKCRVVEHCGMGDSLHAWANHSRIAMTMAEALGLIHFNGPVETFELEISHKAIIRENLSLLCKARHDQVI